MIKATYTVFGTGDEVKVNVLDAIREQQQAQVTPEDWDGKGMWFNNRPIWTVDLSSLTDVRMVCPECGTQFDPEGHCPKCGWDWREPVSDEQDGLDTQAQHATLYREG